MITRHMSRVTEAARFCKLRGWNGKNKHEKHIVQKKEYRERSSLRKGEPSMAVVYARVATIVQPNRANRILHPITAELAIADA